MQEIQKQLTIDERKEIIRLTRYFISQVRKNQLIKSLEISKEEIYMISFLISSLLVLTKDLAPKNEDFFEKSFDFNNVIYKNENYGSWRVTFNFSKNLFNILDKINHRDFYIINKNKEVFNQLETFLENDPNQIFMKICEYLFGKTLEKIEQKKIVTWYLWIVYPELKIFINRTKV